MYKNKAVPLHAIEVLGGRRGIAVTHSWSQQKMGVCGQYYAQPSFIPKEMTHSTHWIGCWVSPRASLGKEAERQILNPCWRLKHSCPVHNQTTMPGQPQLMLLYVFYYIKLHCLLLNSPVWFLCTLPTSAVWCGSSRVWVVYYITLCTI